MTPETVSVRGVALFGELLLTGVLAGVAALPIVTALAAAGAGAILIDELVTEQRTPTVRRFVALLAESLREPVAWVAPLLMLVAGGLDVLALVAGLPCGWLLGPVLLLLLVFCLLCGLRSAGAWRPERGWREALVTAPRAVLSDWPGSVLLVGALAVLGAVVGEEPAFLPVTPGLLLLATLAVQRRRRRKWRSGRRITTPTAAPESERLPE